MRIILAGVGLACAVASNVQAAGAFASVTAHEARAASTAVIIGRWQARIAAGDVIVGAPATWAQRYSRKLQSLDPERLRLAERASTLDELDSLFVEAPISSGTTLGEFRIRALGDVLWAAETGGAKADPAVDPAQYDDLVFTAFRPCRVYDSRYYGFMTPWPAGIPQSIDFGPWPNYSFQGGQFGCLGSGSVPSQVAAVLGSVSTVNQSGPGYLVFWSSGAPNPSPYGVVQYFQAGYVQTSFVVMHTNLGLSAVTRGVAAMASTHVIIDVLGYFSTPKAAALECTEVTGSGVPIAAGTTEVVATPLCAAGFAKVSKNCMPAAGGLVREGEDNLACRIRNPTAGSIIVTPSSTCCRVPGR
jgi:hypothetical protein